MAAVEFTKVIRCSVIESKEFVPSRERHLFFSYSVVCFSKETCGVSERSKAIRKNWLRWWDANICCPLASIRTGVIGEAKPLLIATSEKSGTRWCAYRAGNIAISKLNTVVRNRINVRSWKVATLIPNITVAKIISKKNNDIWRCRTSTTYKTAQ